MHTCEVALINVISLFVDSNPNNNCNFAAAVLVTVGDVIQWNSQKGFEVGPPHTQISYL